MAGLASHPIPRDIIIIIITTEAAKEDEEMEMLCRELILSTEMERSTERMKWHNSMKVLQYLSGFILKLNIYVS